MLRPLGWRVLDCPFGRPLWVESAALQAPEQLQFFILCLVQDTQSHMDDEKVEQKKKRHLAYLVGPWHWYLFLFDSPSFVED